jgi:hypothetical protein
MIRQVSLLALLLSAAGAPAIAHHAISAIYDSGKRVTIEGAVRDFQFVNPHPFLIVEVSERGRTLEWKLEMDNRFELINEGMQADTLKPGDRVVASGSLSRTNPQAMYLMRLDRAADGFRYEQVGASPRVRPGRP